MKYIYKTILLFFITINLVSANVCEQNIFVENKCLTDKCFETKDSYIKPNENFKIILDKEVYHISNFKDWINSEINNNIIDKYPGTFEIEDFCEGENGTDCNDKSFKLSELIDYNSAFRIHISWPSKYENYNDGIEYFFKNYNNILTELSSTNINLLLEDIVTNLKNYDYHGSKHRYRLKNICKNSKCNETNYSYVYGNNTDSYTILKGGNLSYQNGGDHYNLDFQDSGYSHSKIKIGESLKLETTIFTDKPNPNCSDLEFNYDIAYTYKKNNGKESKKINILSDMIKVDSTGNHINTDNHGINYTKINSNNLLEVSLNENISVPEIGELFFYITVTDNMGNHFSEKINSIPVEVISGDPKSDKSYINFTNFDFNSDQSYYKDDIFTSRIYLEDIKGNPYGDDNYGITINHPNSDLVFNGPNKVKSKFDHLGKPFFEFSFKFKQPGNYSKQFKLIIPKVDVNGNLSGENIIFNLGDPSEKINIRPIVVSEIRNLRCSQRIVVIARCTWDAFSGCNGYSSEKKIFESESDNGKEFTLTAKDNAYNSYVYTGIMDHIDRTSPKVDFLDLSFSSLKATDSKKFKIKISDANPRGCRDISKVKYKVLVNKNSIGYIEKISETLIDNIKADIKTIDLTTHLKYIFKEIGNYKIKIVVEDAVGNIENYIKEFNIYPNDLDESNSTISVNSNDNKFANNLDYYTYVLTLKDKFGNPIYNKSLELVEQTTDTNNYLLERWAGTTDNDGKINFYLKSLYPFTSFNQSFKISIKKWGDDYKNNSDSKNIVKTISENNSFKKPISGNFELIEGGDIPEIGKDQKYKVKLNNIGNLNSYNNGKLAISNSSIRNSISGHLWNGNFKNVDNFFGNNINSYVGFVGKIDANSNLLQSPKIKSDNLEISYNLKGELIKYNLDDFEWQGDSCSFETLGLKVIGTLQGDGKGNITGQKSNFSDLSKGKIRSEIRKNAYISIKNRVPGTIINGVKYVNGDITISGDQSYETLIVKNGNVIISGDLNISNKKLGIIVLNDNYDVNSDYNNKGNIYVNNSVSKINSIIYSDGTFRSANSYGTSYYDNDLENKLELYGSLFTRNTIGGAVVGNSSYTLPGGEETSDYDLAKIYDFNHIRKVPKSCDGDDTNDYSFIVKYNPSINSNPPKLFENK